MKLEIDLNEILQDEFGPVENLAESIKRQVVDKLTNELSKGITKKIDSEVSKAIDEQIKKALDEIRPNLINQILDAEYISVTSYGERGKPTTFRTQLIKAVNENMVYKASSYSSDKNAFTSAVDTILRSQVDEFKKQFDAIINKEYVEQTKAFAVETLKKKLGF